MNVGTVSISNVLQRGRISLDGEWNVIVDPYEMGYVGILEQRNDRGFFRDHSPRHPGDRVEYDFDASPTLTVQAAVYAEHVVMIERNRSDMGRGAVAGLSPWILKDFRAPVRVLPGIQDGYNRKGLVSEEGEPKLAFHVLADFYSTIS